jgi:hypothetical protein
MLATLALVTLALVLLCVGFIRMTVSLARWNERKIGEWREQGARRVPRDYADADAPALPAPARRSNFIPVALMLLIAGGFFAFLFLAH